VVAVTASGNSLINSGGSGWNAGASSVETITSGDGFVEFTANDTANYRMGGLGSGDSNQSYTDIEYAVYMVLGGSLAIYESGSTPWSGGSYVPGDIFRVAIESNVVKYYKNGVVFYTSAVTPTGYPYRFDSSFYPGTSISNIKVSSNTLDSWTGNMTNTNPAGTYIYGLKVYDRNVPVANIGSEPARIEVTTTSGGGGTSSFSPDAGDTLANNLVAYWKLNEVSGNRSDSKGSSTLTDNNTVTSTSGKNGLAARFTAASSEFLSSPDNAALSTGGTSYTLAGWVYLGSKSTHQTTLAKYDTGSNREYWAGYDPTVDRFNLYLYNSAGARIGYVAANNFGAPSVGVWYFLIYEYNLATDTLSISVNNGTPNSTLANETTGDPGDTTSTFRIGGDPPAADYWDGYMDEWGMWKRVLTAQEKADLYNASAGNTYTP
jgi:hypothetical protein